ncbi:pRL2-23 [Streptomyces sp. NHF165]|uniref:pRL2-23 n=1 Tax=Streptomyces sp. NHF165 TaxID=2175864 RepID=UPI00132F2F62|nr:pRL2-23 [Streptomyces sp. NHF165]QHF97570.1 pRL2-23 [Streptomyces sp. NHF165]
MWTSLIAVIGTLAGAILSGLLQHRVARSDRADAQAEQLRQHRMDAVAALAVALSDHRRAMWQLRDAQLTDQPHQRVEELLDESHHTRSAVTDPAVRLRLLIADPTVRAAAAEAVQATYRMRDAASLDVLQVQRRAALDAHDAMVEAAGRALA